MTWKLAEEAHILLEEEPAYPWFSFLSDVGGAAGLFLGLTVIKLGFDTTKNVKVKKSSGKILNLVKLMRFFCDCASTIIKRIFRLLHRPTKPSKSESYRNNG